MEKDFDKWNKTKKHLHARKDAPFYHEREIWWCSLGVNIGFEQDGSGEEHRRPALILKGLSRTTCFIVPLTTASHNHPMRPSVGCVEGKEARALLSQIRAIDSRRLVRKIGYLNGSIFKQIRKAAKTML